MEILKIVLIVVLGLVMGSFFACMGYRIPNKISTTKSRSFCPKCKKELKWYMNIPVFSYIFLGGKCAYCHKKISIIYPFIEVTSAFLFFLAYEVYINTLPVSYLYFIIAITLSSAFLVTIVSDFMYYYISDRVILISLIIVLITKFVFLDVTTCIYSIISGVVMFLIMMLIKLLGNKMFKKESLGDGDIKLVGVIGASIGIIPSLISIFIASITGLIFAIFSKSDDKSGIVPFGPFILLGSIISLYLINIINNMFGNILTVL